MVNDTPEYFYGPYLKNDKISYRHYQNNIVNQCQDKNSLVVLPTGLGKTVIAVLLIARSLNKYSETKIIVLAPTRPLIYQHEASCKKFLDIDEKKINSLTGKISPEKRMLLFKESRIIISTPQVVKNDLMRGRYELNQVSLMIFDESHRTKGNYAYNFISKEYMKCCTDPLILGLTASPGKDYVNIQDMCDNLFIENIIFKTIEDEDVREYVHEIDTFIDTVELPMRILEISQVWDNLFKKFLRFFVDKNLINPYKNYFSKLDFLKIARDLTFSLRFENFNNSKIENDEYLNLLYFQSPKIIDIVKEKKLNIQSIFSYCSSCISILHGKDLLETQDISLFKSFLEKIKFKTDQDVLSAKRITNSKHYQLINSIIEKEDQSNLSHPKINKIVSIINEELEKYHNKKIIIFTQYREMAELLKNKLNIIFHRQITIEKFIGQTTKIDDSGFPQQKQIEILEDFRQNKINILIATSVAEEGLDIPNVDAVIFYEPVASEIRSIQRRGRTGRLASGRCYILLTKDTVDVPFYKVAQRKEETMNFVLLNPENLKLTYNITRQKIKCSNFQDNFSEIDLIINYKKRKELEEKLLVDRSIEEIITELDNFPESEEYKKLKNCGITFYSDIIKLDKDKLRNSVLKLKSKRNLMPKEQKIRLNKNIKTLINITKTHGKNGKMDFSLFKNLARDEEIADDKFNVHFNQACYLGYLKKEKNNIVSLIKDYC